jgi:outer membrane immunogenic protein
MKKAFLGSVALVALSLGTSAGFAAEKRVPAPAPVPPPPAPAYTWSGCYVGGSAGTSQGRSTHFTTAGSAIRTLTTVGPVLPAGVNITDSFNLSGFIGGGQVGCNWQWGAWVFGIEGDGSATNKEGQAFEFPLVPVIGGAAGAARANWISQTQERWLVTARAKLGLTNFWWFGPNSLVYVTGGGAWAKIDVSEFLAGNFTGNPLGSGHQESSTRSGWTVGAGYEYALGYGWSIKGEYLYVKFDDFTTFTTAPFAVLGGNVAPREVRLEDHIFRAGMNYKFW